jgi:uncharacterized membrane protein
LSAAVFGLKTSAVGGGMGTSGLVGVFETVTTSINGGVADWKLGLGIAVCYFIIPIVVTLGLSEFMRKMGWIKYGDMTLPK